MHLCAQNCKPEKFYWLRNPFAIGAFFNRILVLLVIEWGNNMAPAGQLSWIYLFTALLPARHWRHPFMMISSRSLIIRCYRFVTRWHRNFSAAKHWRRSRRMVLIMNPWRLWELRLAVWDCLKHFTYSWVVQMQKPHHRKIGCSPRDSCIIPTEK